jgi:hypothetical protein
MKKKDCIITKQNKKEIMYNLINSFLAGGLVFLGSFTNGFSKEGVIFALIAFGIVALTKFKNYWDGEVGEYSNKLFTFVKI